MKRGAFVISAEMDNNAPHMSPQQRADYVASIPAYQKNARSKGVPQLGAGLILPVLEEDFLIDAFPIPNHWPRGYALDVGWNRTAAMWIAKDPDTGTKYFIDEHYRSEATPEIHGAAIRKRGTWLPGKIDPAARGRSQDDGKKLLTLYRKEIYGHEDLAIGVRLLTTAVNAVESGLYDLLMALQQGHLKVFKNRCPNWLAERRLYRRDERGRVVKKFDHAMDAGRYAFASGDAWLLAKPVEALTLLDPFGGRNVGGADHHPLAWMGN